MATYSRRFTFNAGRSRSGLVGRVRYTLDGGTNWINTGFAETAVAGSYAVTATIDSGLQGEITFDTNDGDMLDPTVDQTAGGSGYTDGTGYALGITGGGGTGAAGTFDVVSGSVTNIQITARGQGFTSAPALSFPGAGSGTGAAATASLTTPRGASEPINPGGNSEYLTPGLAATSNLVATGTVVDTNPTAKTFIVQLDNGAEVPSGTDWVGRLSIKWTSGGLWPAAAEISDYRQLSTTTALVTVGKAFSAAPANGDAFALI